MGKLKSGKPRTKNPAKQLLFLLVDAFLRKGKSKDYDTAVDLACGAMYFGGLISAKHYVGVDLDLERLEQGKAEHPHARIIHSKIEDLPPDLSGDLVLCLQCVGVNKHFDSRQALEVTDKILAATRPRGDLVFNVGPGVFASFREIDNRVRQSFADFRRYDYGRFNGTVLKNRKGLVLSMLLAQLMRAFPRLAYTPRWRLYICQGKLADAACEVGVAPVEDAEREGAVASGPLLT
jgi:hypothetical protein